MPVDKPSTDRSRISSPNRGQREDNRCDAVAMLPGGRQRRRRGRLAAGRPLDRIHVTCGITCIPLHMGDPMPLRCAHRAALAAHRVRGPPAAPARRRRRPGHRPVPRRLRLHDAALPAARPGSTCGAGPTPDHSACDWDVPMSPPSRSVPGLEQSPSPGSSSSSMSSRASIVSSGAVRS